MKKNKANKIFSAIAVLAMSATAICGAVSFAGCGTKYISENNVTDLTVNNNKTTISTANGPVQTTTSGKIYYVAPDAAANGTGESWDNTMPVYKILNTATSPLEPGDTVYLKPGTYEWTNLWYGSSGQGLTLEKSGTYDKYIRIINAALDKENSGYTGTETEAILSFYGMDFNSNSRGVQLYGSYIYWYGIDICGAGDNGMYIGGNFNTVEYCDFYNNRDTGLQLGRSYGTYTTVDQWPNYNLIKNCTSHNNYDNETYGENADGFAAKLTVGYGNVFDGCIAYRNSDDGWDLYAKTDSGNIGQVIIYNCVAFENGYLEYTQRECNALYPTWQARYSEDATNPLGLDSYKTRDGDGNGFKLGGSVMEGDVLMYNCLSYYNRMHGVTDNSNPGVLSVNNVTSYNNSGAIDNNPESAYFGKVVAELNDANHSNIDVARQSYSYNNLSNILSVWDAVANSLDSDAYRGSVTNSYLLSVSKKAVTDDISRTTGASALVVNGSIDADTKVSGADKGVSGNMLVSSEVFKELPVVYTPDGETKYEYNLDGSRDLYADDDDIGGELSETRVHVYYRNEDGSINMRDILAKANGLDNNLIAGEDLGSTLNKDNWGAYTHFFAQGDIVNGNAASENSAIAERAVETLTINCNPNAVYQDFEVAVSMYGCSISWATDDDDHLVIKSEEVSVDVSDSKYIMVEVYRPETEKVQATLTATVTVGEGESKVELEKEFVVTIMPGIPTLGEVQVLTDDGVYVTNGQSLVIDTFYPYNEPEVLVANGLDYNGKLLKADQYNVETTYMYAPDSNSHAVEIKGFTASTSGVYTITNKVSLKSDPTQTAQMSYTVFVASATAQVDFNGDAAITVNRDGYIIAGNMSSATGVIYAISSAEELTDVKAADILSSDKVTKYQFRGETISYQFKNDNSTDYYIYYVLTNIAGEVTSEVYSEHISVIEIENAEDFMTVAGGAALGSEDVAKTIYQLTTDLDFTDVEYKIGSGNITGLINGMGHTISNVTVDTGANYASVFYRVKGGTIENFKFKNVVINGSQAVGLISRVYGGYVHNISIENIRVTGSQRVAALIGQIYQGDTYISQISVVNPIPELNADGMIKDATNEEWIISSSANRAAGIVGLMQTESNNTVDTNIYISDCYVSSYIYCGTYCASAIFGEYQDSYDPTNSHVLDINHCVSTSVIVSGGASSRLGGILGYQTGTDVLNITNCVSVGKFYYSGTEVLTSQKNLSGIIGNFNSAANATLTNNIAMMEEYNTDYQDGVTVATDTVISRPTVYNNLSYDFEEKWTLVYDGNSTTELKAPYLTLNFLGDWE